MPFKQGIPLLVLVEATTNIAGHICARGLNDSPASYADAFLSLARGGVLDEELALRLAKMAGFRNLLVHGYAAVEDHRMLEMMRNDLRDVIQFLECVQRLWCGGRGVIESLRDQPERIGWAKQDMSSEKREWVLEEAADYLRGMSEVSFAYAHGSFLQPSLSFGDIDIAVCFFEDVPPERRLDLSLDIGVRLSHQLGVSVDAHPLNGASLGFIFSATQGRVLCSHNDDERFDFVERKRLEYFEFSILQLQIITDLLAGR